MKFIKVTVTITVPSSEKNDYHNNDTVATTFFDALKGFYMTTGFIEQSKVVNEFIIYVKTDTKLNNVNYSILSSFLKGIMIGIYHSHEETVIDFSINKA